MAGISARPAVTMATVMSLATDAPGAGPGDFARRVRRTTRMSMTCTSATPQSA